MSYLKRGRAINGQWGISTTFLLPCNAKSLIHTAPLSFCGTLAAFTETVIWSISTILNIREISIAMFTSTLIMICISTYSIMVFLFKMILLEICLALFFFMTIQVDHTVTMIKIKGRTTYILPTGLVNSTPFRPCFMTLFSIRHLCRSMI